MRSSILSTLKETFSLWKKHLGFFLLLAFFVNFPDSVFTHVSRRDDFTLWNVLNGAAAWFFPVIFQAVGMAATLSLFRTPPDETKWLLMIRGVQRYTGQLVGVQLLITVIVLAMFVPIGVLFAFIHLFSPFWVALMVALSYLLLLVMLKYALADPLVVVEELKAMPALSASWRMTKNRFGYVFGCYFLLAFAIGTIYFLTGHGTRWFHASIWIAPSLKVFFKLMDTVWFVLPWIMYLRIREAGDTTSQVTEEGCQ
jgi:hypothetical protein